MHFSPVALRVSAGTRREIRHAGPAAHAAGHAMESLHEATKPHSACCRGKASPGPRAFVQAGTLIPRRRAMVPPYMRTRVSSWTWQAFNMSS